ncbi:nuclear transport factor 2 family protein [Novosphingobium profundi]|uniref:nuclear transport factor 2 family protein n=1 Tax=Novosphingobium profundi TaxID=1774954 RepID=UPI001BDB5F43|nr:nuclear transport factor 2 family protein [Novosphingobium profundi]MBT0667309.1 nuclear transport factor 2 family protein [Novosphingobium profundi]
MPQTPVEVLKAILDNPTDLANVASLTSPDVTYVSLNYDNSQLKRVMPWCGTGHGPEVIVKTFLDVARFWTVEAFEPQALFGDQHHAAMFGSFTYRSTVLGKQVTSPFAVFARVEGGKCSYLQFMEDTLATTESFHIGGEWTIHSDPQGHPTAI